ncbi:leucine-rich repeat-containing protein 40-like [Clytia hemisphaerica]|uniref:EGF-like domain-containing protein n=1 Tax=Clytia hemisphaerica TaxID=252671 RepID=A0A7M5WUA9_9CNID
MTVKLMKLDLIPLVMLLIVAPVSSSESNIGNCSCEYGEYCYKPFTLKQPTNGYIDRGECTYGQICDCSHRNMTQIPSNIPIHNLVSLNLANNYITTVSDQLISKFTKLRYLDLTSNPITERKIFKEPLPALFELRLQSGSLDTASLNGFHLLRKLVIHGDNTLTNINMKVLSELKQLEQLEVLYTNLTTLPTFFMDGFYRLKKLEFKGNKNLETIGFEAIQNTPNLLQLILKDNNLKKLTGPITKNARLLADLDLSFNQLSTINEEMLQGFKSLEKLDLSNNGIRLTSSLSKSALARLPKKKLKELRLNNNLINRLPRGFFGNSEHLSILDLSFNNFKSLNTTNFKYLRRLEVLKLQNIGSDLVHFELDLRRLSYLREVDISSNCASSWLVSRFYLSNAKIVNISNSCQKTLPSFNSKYLDLSFNNLSKVVLDFINTEGYVNLSYNQIQSIEIKKDFKTVDLSHNLIEDITDIKINPDVWLGNLNCSHNHLTTIRRFSNVIEISPTGPYHLRQEQGLDFSHNSIQHIDLDAFSAFSQLRYLNLKGNKLNDSLRLELSNKLKTINLGTNSFTKVPTFFPSLIDLVTIDLSGNSLKEVTENSFNGFNKLRNLNLRNTNLTDLPKNFLRYNTEKISGVLDLSNNDFRCSCNVLSAIKQVTREATVIGDCRSNATNDLQKLSDRASMFIIGGKIGCDVCSQDPCRNFGKCVQDKNGARCSCFFTYTGTLCEKREHDTTGRPFLVTTEEHDRTYNTETLSNHTTDNYHPTRTDDYQGDNNSTTSGGAPTTTLTPGRGENEGQRDDIENSLKDDVTTLMVLNVVTLVIFVLFIFMFALVTYRRRHISSEP